jgi:uncharacterized membrane protein
MTPIMIFAGVLLLIFGLAALGGGPTAATGRQQDHSRTYSLALIAGGVVILGFGLVALLR